MGRARDRYDTGASAGRADRLTRFSRSVQEQTQRRCVERTLRAAEAAILRGEGDDFDLELMQAYNRVRNGIEPVELDVDGSDFGRGW